MTASMTAARRLAACHNLSDEELRILIEERDRETFSFLRYRAQAQSIEHYGKNIFLRGLIEFTNYCKNDCYYCGIRKSNAKARRYRLSPEDIISCCRTGYALGFRTFVLQGGEDPWFTDQRLCRVVTSIKDEFPDAAITLSAGERSAKSYRMLKEAGADRYLLRHETATDGHYALLHPPAQQLSTRMDCLHTLRELGYQTGCGFMVGSPGQTVENLVADLRFIKEFNPHMVGIGPFLSHRDTPFSDMPDGSGELTLFLLSVIRLLLPKVLLPATTALGTLLPNGREEGILHGANVVMPNLSPQSVRAKYNLYDNKLSSGAKAAESVRLLWDSFDSIGYRAVVSRGDSLVE